MSCDAFFATITWLGSLYFLLPAAAVLSFLLLWMGRSHEALLLGLSLSCSVIAAHVLKLLLRRPRPEASDLLIPMPSDWSFPSAHTTQAAAFFLTATIIAARTLPPIWAKTCTVASVLIIFAVGWSRVYLQVHYLTDVVAGCALAAIIVTAIAILLPYLHAHLGS